VEQCKIGQESFTTANHKIKSNRLYSLVMNLTFIGPSIVIYSYSTTNKIHLLSQIIYSCKTLYMFWGGFSVHYQERKTAYTATIYVKQLLLPAAFGDGMELVLRS